jgi:hypothetical protein
MTLDHRLLQLHVLIPTIQQSLPRQTARRTFKPLQQSLLSERNLPAEEQTTTLLLQQHTRDRLSTLAPGALWELVDQAFKEAATLTQRLIKQSEKPRQPWIMDSTWQLIQQRRPLVKVRLQLEQQAKLTLCQSGWTGSLKDGLHLLPDPLKGQLTEALLREHTAHKVVKKSLRNDKKIYLSSLADTLLSQVEEGNFSSTFKIAHKLCRTKRFTNVTPVDPQGRLPSNDLEELRIWADWLKSARGMQPLGKEFHSALPPFELRLSDSALRAAFHSLRSNKASDPTVPPTVAWQTAFPQLCPRLMSQFQQLSTQPMPQAWATNSLFWLHKPGKPGRSPDCFRDICLVHPAAKAYSSLILYQNKPLLTSAVLPNHFGFLPGRSVSDALCITRETKARCRQGKCSLLTASFDLQQAFYKIDRTLLSEALLARLQSESTFGIPQKI